MLHRLLTGKIKLLQFKLEYFMDFIRDFIARRINGIANAIAPDPLRRNRKKQLKEIEKVLDEMDWDVVILKRKEFYEMTGKMDPLKESKTPGKKVSIDDLPDDFKLDPAARQFMDEMGITDFYFEDSYYDDSDLMNSGMGLPPNFGYKPTDKAKVIQTPEGPLAIEMDGRGAPDSLDSVFNFAIFYCYGSKKNNIVTFYSVDAQDRLYVHNQIQFTVTNYKDVIDLCDDIIEKHDLDSLVFINTDVAKRMVNYVKKGIHKESVTVKMATETYDYDTSLQHIVPLMGIGKVFVGMGDWLEILQQQLMSHMSLPPNKRGSMGNNFTRLKAFINGVKYWEDGVENEAFVRNYGITDTDNTHAEKENRS